MTCSGTLSRLLRGHIGDCIMEIFVEIPWNFVKSHGIMLPSGKLTVGPNENHQFLEETNLPTPFSTRVYVNLLEGMYEQRSHHRELGLTMVVFLGSLSFVHAIFFSACRHSNMASWRAKTAICVVECPLLSLITKGYINTITVIIYSNYIP